MPTGHIWIIDGDQTYIIDENLNIVPLPKKQRKKKLKEDPAQESTELKVQSLEVKSQSGSKRNLTKAEAEAEILDLLSN